MASSVSDSALEELCRLKSSFAGTSIPNRRWRNISTALSIIAQSIWIVRDIEKLGNSLEVGEVPDPVVRFYNETIAYMMGTPRVFDVHVWEGVNSWLSNNQPFDVNNSATSANIGAAIMSTYMFNDGKIKEGLSQRKGTRFNKALLSYANADVLYRWTLQPNGIDDIVAAMPLLARVHRRLKELDD